MGAHRTPPGWWHGSRRHLLWLVTAAAVLLISAAVSVVARSGSGLVDGNDQIAFPATSGPNAPNAGRTAPLPAVVPSTDPSAQDRDGSQVGDAEPSQPATGPSEAGQPGSGASRPTSGAPRPPVEPGPTGRPGPPTPAGPTPVPQGALTATYTVPSAWGNGYVATVEVRNTGPASAAWALELRLPGGVRLDQHWNARFAVSGSEASGVTVQITPEHTPILDPGSSIVIGYTAIRTSQGTRPAYCAVNGRTCQ